MKLPLHIAAKLLLLQQLEKLPASSLKHEVVDELLQEGLLQKQMQGRGRTYLFAPSAAALAPYLHNRFGINDLQAYVQTMQSNTTNRSALVEATSNSKTKRLRSFTGFMVATPEPMNVTLNHQPVTLLPHPGLFTYVADYANFEVPADVTIVGVENAENFNNLPQQAYLFKHLKPLFVCRYPYSGDLLHWLRNIPNTYLHFGDIDFAGINIFLNEYYVHLGERSSFFTPPGLPELLAKYGNRNLYNKQSLLTLQPSHKAYAHLQPIVDLLHLHKKGLEQEIFIGLQKNANDD